MNSIPMGLLVILKCLHRPRWEKFCARARPPAPFGRIRGQYNAMPDIVPMVVVVRVSNEVPLLR